MIKQFKTLFAKRISFLQSEHNFIHNRLQGSLNERFFALFLTDKKWKNLNRNKNAVMMRIKMLAGEHLQKLKF